MRHAETVDLNVPLSLRNAFLFPLQTRESRIDLLWGAFLLFFPVVGWILNMGHRIILTHRMQHRLPPWPAWTNYRLLFRHGCMTFLGMVEYHAPAVIVGLVARHYQSTSLFMVAAVLWILATAAVPG